MTTLSCFARVKKSKKDKEKEQNKEPEFHTFMVIEELPHLDV